MDLDFHYYATYVAAMAAGHSQEEATVIATAAQYVDESDSSRVAKLKGRDPGFDLVPTVQSFKDSAWSTIPNSGTTDVDTRRVWVPFHFLPGNYRASHHPDPGAAKRVKTYAGATQWGPPGYRWKYDQRGQWQFALLCLPYSPLAQAMINDTRQNHRDSLEMVGLRMHVLADTWAHMYFAGTPSWWVNEAGANVYAIEEGRRSKITWGGAYSEWSTPAATSFESLAYLGHGRMGHVPDYAWLKYEYTPQWSSHPITKDNTQEFMRAFVEMVRAMRAIREGKTYTFSDTPEREVAAELLEAVELALSIPHPLGGRYQSTLEARCGGWRLLLERGMFKVAGTPVPLPPAFDAEAWSDFEHHPHHYIRFNRAAGAHLAFVTDALAQEGIEL